MRTIPPSAFGSHLPLHKGGFGWRIPAQGRLYGRQNCQGLCTREALGGASRHKGGFGWRQDLYAEEGALVEGVYHFFKVFPAGEGPGKAQPVESLYRVGGVGRHSYAHIIGLFLCSLG